MRKVQSYQEFQSKKASKDPSRVEHYAPPEHVIQPAKGDKGFALLKGMLAKVKKIIEPGIWSTT
jgi:hypothetical protein